MPQPRGDGQQRSYSGRYPSPVLGKSQMGLTFPESTCRWGALPSPQAPSLVGRPEEASCGVEPLNALPFVGSVKQKPCKGKCTVIF